MPCACLIPIPSYPETAEWGPILWTILHGLAEKAGQGFIRSDEIREWHKFIKITGEILPCETCKEHYQTFLKTHPPDVNLIKQWFWNLHNEVNLRRGVPVYEYDISKYSNVNLTDLLYRLMPVIKKAIELSGVPYMKWTSWVSSFKMLRSILAV
jgi:hypothetical protein